MCPSFIFFNGRGDPGKGKVAYLKVLVHPSLPALGVPGITFHFNNYTFVFLLYFIIYIFLLSCF